jgi:hypothetical protein
MRARDFLSEDNGDDSYGGNGDASYGGNGEKASGSKGKLHHHHKSAIKGWNTLPELPGWYYNMYRFGVHMAGSPDDQDMDSESPSSNQMSLYAYTDADQAIIDKSKKDLGYKGKKLSGNRSEEPEGTNKTSPVAQHKKNRYGI